MGEPIEIIIRKGQGGDGGGFGVPGAKVDESPRGRNTAFGTEGKGLFDKTNGDYALKATASFAVAALRKEINYNISQYGNMTGNYIAQARMQEGMSVMNQLIGVGSAAIAGFKIGGPMGAAITGSIAAVNLGINYYHEYRTAMVGVVKLNTHANIMRERSGNAYNNESRGTYE